MEKTAIELSVIGGGMAGFLGKVVWDWFKSGRAEGGVYMKTADCLQIREKCCVGQVKKSVHTLETELAEHGIRLHETEKQLDRGREDFKAIRADISEIKTILAKMTIIFENGLKKIGE